MLRKLDLIIKEILSIDISQSIRDSDELELYGLDSLNFINLVIEIENAFDIKFEDTEIMYSNFCTKSFIINTIRIAYGRGINNEL